MPWQGDISPDPGGLETNQNMHAHRVIRFLSSFLLQVSILSS